jgi:hypothetical protein
VLLALLAALLAAAAKPPDEYLDEDTAATLTAVTWGRTRAITSRWRPWR